MEKEIVINTGDKHSIYGTLNSKKKSDKLMIFVHGLTGNQKEHIFFNSAKFFTKHGFDTFRFDLYTWKKNGRKLRDCTLDIHAKDTNKVIEHFRNKYKKVFLVGHSYGGLTILKTDTSLISGMILWDASYSKGTSRGTDWINEKNYNKHLDAYILDWGVELIIGKAMFEEAKTLPHPRLIKRINVPVKIICAGKSRLVKAGKLYFKYAKNPKEFTIIKDASHTFSEEGTEDKLFKETLKFVTKHSRHN